MILAYAIGAVIILGLTAICAWKGNPVLFMIISGISIMEGLYSPDALAPLGYSTFGIGVGIMLIFYSFVCIGLAYANLFKGTMAGADED